MVYITIITIGIDLESSRKAIELAEKYPGVLATVGIHPQESKGVKREDIDRLAEMARHPQVVAIGEMGLDYYRDRSPRDSPVEGFAVGTGNGERGWLTDNHPLPPGSGRYAEL